MQSCCKKIYLLLLFLFLDRWYIQVLSSHCACKIHSVTLKDFSSFMFLVFLIDFFQCKNVLSYIVVLRIYVYHLLVYLFLWRSYTLCFKGQIIFCCCYGLNYGWFGVKTLDEQWTCKWKVWKQNITWR